MSQHSNPLSVENPQELLRCACERSAVVELHSHDHGVTRPAARGRLLGFSKSGNLLLDKPQVIGMGNPLHVRQIVDAFFQIDDELYTFATSVVRLDVPVRLNAEKRTFGAEIALPGGIKRGQRRGAFRTSLALHEPIMVRLHRTNGESPDQTPVNAHHFMGIITDASDGGFGVRIDNVPYTRFSLFDKYFLSYRLPDETENAVVLCELRQTREIRGGESAKLGLLILPWPSHRHVNQIRQPLLHYLMSVQRRVRKAG